MVKEEINTQNYSYIVCSCNILIKHIFSIQHRIIETNFQQQCFQIKRKKKKPTTTVEVHFPYKNVLLL